MKITALQIAGSIRLKEFKNDFPAQLIFSDSDELFYSTNENSYVYIFKYGVVSFANFSEVEIAEFKNLIVKYSKNIITESSFSEEFEIKKEDSYQIAYDHLSIAEISEDVVRLSMFNVSQSVALEYYSSEASKMLENTNFYIEELESKGKTSQKGKRLLQFIGKTLNLRNKIIENLYIFDTHPVAWEDELLNKLDNDLSKTFDLKQRYRNVSESLNIVKENLDLFKDLMQFKKSEFLEWVIVILILIEVLAFMFEKII